MWPPVTTEGLPLRGSSCILPRLLLNFLTRFLNIPPTVAFSLHTSHIWRWISAGFTFLAFKKKWITDRISQSTGRSIIFNILNAQNITQTLSAFLVLASVAGQWMREDSAHARNYDLSAAAEIFANDAYFPNTLRI
jgi:hypothetical protein